MLVYRVRRKSDGLFLGARKWGESHTVIGKFYASLGHARNARTNAGVSKDHEVVEYELAEIRVLDAEEK